MDLADTIARAKRGDRDAVDGLVEQFYPAVRRVAHRELALRLRRSEPALAALFSTRDVVQDVFMGALRHLDDFEGGDAVAFQAFLTSCVTNRLLDMLRYHHAAQRDVRRVAGRGLPDTPAEARSPATEIGDREEATLVDAALANLSARDRALLELRIKRGVAYADIARQLGLPTADAARKAVCAAQSRVLMSLRSRGVR